MKGFPDLPPIWLAGFMALAWVLAGTIPLAGFAGPVAAGVGLFLALAGLSAILWAAQWFRRSNTTIEPHHNPASLIRNGPFAWSRNPIYLGMVAILTGQVLWLGAVPGLILPPGFVWVLTRRFIEPEETRLVVTFGDAARQYMTQVRRWL